MARGGQRGATQQRRGSGSARTRRNEEGIIPQLARAVREVEAAVARRSAMPEVRAKFQVVALLAREERARVKGDTTLSDGRRGEELKRLDGIATILAQTAARDSTLFTLLDENAEISESAKAMRRELLRKAGVDEPEPEPEPVVEDPEAAALLEKRVIPLSVQARQLANPFLVPDFAHARAKVRPRRLAGWELLEPLFRSFERAAPDAPACMPLPDADQLTSLTGRHAAPAGRELMAHQAQLIASAAAGHRTYLLADEPGLGKTAQALLAAEAAGAFPLLAVVPNVVKTNWAREVEIWTPNRRATVLHGDGGDADGFADVFVVNYEILDRHVGWLGTHGFRGMIVDEAHYIKNKSSQRSQNVLELSERIRARIARPLMMALTGTPLINDIEDFRAIWQFLGWIDDVVPQGDLMEALEETGLTPADPGFYPAARRAVVDQGIVRRRKIDVAADIPARRIADMPVELEGEAGRSIRKAERELARRMVERYDAAIATRRTGAEVEGIDHRLVRQVAGWEREDTSTKTGENVFEMMRRIGQAKAGLAADYTAQLARNVGKVVFFAKHIDVMDQAEKTFAERGIRYSSVRGDQSSTTRQREIDAFVNDPDVQVAVCSLTAAGVGLNLQVASNLVLAELSWTDAEQTQAIDRVHRIGQAEPVTAWRVIATQTLDTRIAELIDKKAGLAARALDGAGDEVEGGAIDLQTEALVALLTGALEARGD
ncbi:DEAD/DEAH box helicase [Nocardioides sp. WV_118_6]|uniref:DEAD/DEAH box helicase n=1 Tax=Pimelobacter TaxID=2044 RepID=UPI001C05514D|nr:MULTISPECIES: DEAD/DEAH box helicase [Pimelobacter]MBU2696888.1 helicase [Pimelobacter sp. 30-1]UUW87291.1 DEAD/DEAH box helicase [Pimelobacter simplex]UUW96797.1 DEAD/DEAH box helicase [Pimelobacter simplex]